MITHGNVRHQCTTMASELHSVRGETVGLLWLRECTGSLLW